jgi:hypothetical protein
VFGAHLIDAREIAAGMPPRSVIVNLEQMRGSRLENNPAYVDLLTRLAVWDYSARNIAEVRALTGNARIARLGIGYVPQMRRVSVPEAQPTDVLFYGSINERRRAVLQALQAPACGCATCSASTAQSATVPSPRPRWCSTCTFSTAAFTS